MVENLLFNVLEYKFPDNKTIWYYLKQNRAHDFSLLIRRLDDNKKHFSPDQRELILKLISLIHPFRREANLVTHRIIEYLNEVGELDALRIPDIIQLEIELIRKIRSEKRKKPKK